MLKRLVCEFIISKILIIVCPWEGPSGLHLKGFFSDYTDGFKNAQYIKSWAQCVIDGRGVVHILVIEGNIYNRGKK